MKQQVSNKISRSIGVLNRLKRFLPQYTLLLLYNSLVLPHLQYCILCWGFKSSRLFKLQKRAMRYISNSKYNAHTSPIFKKLKLLKITDIYNLSLLKFYFKLKNNKLPQYFYSMISTHEHSYSTRFRNDPLNPYTRTSSARHSVRNHLYTFLRTVPPLIINKVDTHSLSGFTNYSKNHYVNSYEEECKIVNCYICTEQNS